MLNEGYPFVYVRDETHLVVFNPGRDPARFDASQLSGVEPLLVDGVSIIGGTVAADGFGYGVFALSALRPVSRPEPGGPRPGDRL